MFSVRVGKPVYLTVDLSAHLFRDYVQGGHEVLVAHQGQGVEHIDDADDVEDDGAVPPLLLGEEVVGEEVVPLLLLLVILG